MITKNKQIKIVIITSGGMNGRRLAHLFSINKIPYDLVTVSFPLPKKRKKININYIKKYIRGILSNIKILRDFKMRKLPPYPKREKFVGRLNKSKMYNFLKKTNPDYIFMMGGGILQDDIIKTAKMGVLNAHPGLLPYIRGVDAIEHAILKDVSIGVTGHYIDAGIDTGAIIERYWLPIKEHNTLDQVIKKSNTLSVAVMFKFAKDIVEGNELKKNKQDVKYSLCKKLSVEKLKEADQKFKNEWYKTHSAKIAELNDIYSGKNLLDKYENWWKGKGQF